MSPARQQQVALEQLATPVDCSMGLTSSIAAQNKRKEKARVAARIRRSQEASIIMDMANELHITHEKIRRLDKATIVKLAIDYIKAFEILCRFRTICNSTPILTNSILSSPHNNNSRSNSSSNSDDNDISSNNCDTINDNISEQHDDNKHAIINITGSIKIENNHDNSNFRTTLSYGPAVSNAARESPIAVAARAEAPATFDDKYQNPPIPKFNTGSIFAHKTDEVDSHFLVIKEQDGRAAFVLKPDTEIMDEDDLTHLAPQAGDSVSLEVEPLDGIVIDSNLFKICGCRY